jgi:hypothetical protein
MLVRCRDWNAAVAAVHELRRYENRGRRKRWKGEWRKWQYVVYFYIKRDYQRFGSRYPWLGHHVLSRLSYQRTVLPTMRGNRGGTSVKAQGSVIS